MPTETGTKVLSEQQANAVALIEQTYFLHGTIPTNEIIANKLGYTPATIARYWQNPTFRQALIKRGVDLRPDSTKDILTPAQLLIANMLLNAHDKRSVREKLAEANVTSVQYHAWLRQEAFRNYLSKRAEDIFSASDHEAYSALLDAVKGADVGAIKFFFEMRGKYTPKAQLDVNVEALMVRVVEIIAKHVKDATILTAIADEIETLAVGGRAVAPQAVASPTRPLPLPSYTEPDSGPEPPEPEPTPPPVGGGGGGGIEF